MGRNNNPYFNQSGHSGGTVTFPVAVVEDENGLHEVEVWRVKDIEGEANED